MSNGNWFINDSRVVQYQQNLREQAAAERSLRAMRREQRSNRANELTQPVSAAPDPSRLRHAWSSLVTILASFL